MKIMDFKLIEPFEVTVHNTTNNKTHFVYVLVVKILPLPPTKSCFHHLKTQPVVYINKIIFINIFKYEY